LVNADVGSEFNIPTTMVQCRLRPRHIGVDCFVGYPAAATLKTVCIDVAIVCWKGRPAKQI
jgi:hypothetical protein